MTILRLVASIVAITAVLTSGLMQFVESLAKSAPAAMGGLK